MRLQLLRLDAESGSHNDHNLVKIIKVNQGIGRNLYPRLPLWVSQSSL